MKIFAITLLDVGHKFSLLRPSLVPSMCLCSVCSHPLQAEESGETPYGCGYAYHLSYKCWKRKKLF